MKLDGEPEYRVSESNEFQDNQMDAVALKEDNEIRMDWKQGFTSFTECKSCKKVTDPSQLGDGDKPGSHGFKNDSISDSQEEGGHVISPLSVSIPQSEMVKKETNFYTDKAVTDIELPQMIICFKEGSYHVIKDICIDEGFHSFEKVLVENEVDNRRVDNIFHSATDGSKYLFSEKPVLGGLKSSDLNEPPVTEVEKEVAKESSSKNLEGGDKFELIDEPIDELSKDEIIASELLVLQNLDIDHCLMHSSNTESNSGIPQSVGGAHGQSADDNSNQEQSDEVAMDKNSESKDFPSNSKEESGSITFDFDSGPPAISATIQSQGKTEHQQSVHVITKSEHEEVSVDGLTASARSSFVHHGYADSIFPGPASLSSSIAYSGQIPYSGNISLRSDSSTTSTRSFAFPILQTEWNSSPIKMAKADRRLYKKHRSWMLGLLCCRF